MEAKENQEIKQIVLAIEGPDGSGKDTAFQRLNLAFYTADHFSVGSELHLGLRDHEFVVSEAILPFYAFPSGDFIRLTNRGVGAAYAAEKGLDVDTEVRVRKALYAVERLIIYAAEAVFLKLNSNPNTKVLIRCQDRSALSQIHTEAGVYHRRGLHYEPNWDTLMDADEEIMKRMEFHNAVLLPFSAKTTAVGSGKRENLDDLEQLGPQEIALNAYRNIAQEGLFNSYAVPVQDDKGDWLNPTDIYFDIINKSKIRPVNSTLEKPLELAMLRRFQGSGGHQIVQAPRTNIFAFMPFAEIKGVTDDEAQHSLDFNWFSMRKMMDGDKSMENYEGKSKKDILWGLEFGLSRVSDRYLRTYRLDEDRLEMIPEYITKELLRLFGQYTDGLLWDFHNYIVQHRGIVLKNGEETDAEYGKGYLLFLRDLLRFSKERHE